MNKTKSSAPFGQSGQSGKNKKNSKENLGQQAAAAGIGAMAGGLAGWAANAMTHDVPDPEAEEEEIEVVAEEQPAAPAAAATAHQTAPQTSGQSAAQAIADNNPAQNAGNGSSSSAEPQTQSNAGHSQQQQQPAEQVNVEDIEIQVEEIDLSADDEADAIIASTEIDSADINADEKVVFDNIGTVYTLDGESYSAATFHFEGDEEQFVMVDVDGDEVFDIITDENFTQEIATPFDFSYGDAEQQLSAEDPNYMAAAENDLTMPDGIDYTDDIITT